MVKSGYFFEHTDLYRHMYFEIICLWSRSSICTGNLGYSESSSKPDKIGGTNNF